VLRVRFAGLWSDEDHPITFKATPDTGDAIDGKLTGDGRLEIDLPPDTSSVTVELFRGDDDEEGDGETAPAGEDDGAADGSGQDGGAEDGGADDQGQPFATYEFGVGELDPLREIAGIQARLLSLGFYDGDITGEIDDDTRAAITQFRQATLGDSKDDIDDAFIKALHEAYGV
jgi:hypothetical protein